jgi:hypothetical protein
MVWINNGNDQPLVVRIDDPIPAAVSFAPGSLTCAPQGSTVVTACVFDVAANRIVVDARIGPDLGNATEAAAANELVITLRTTRPSAVATNVAAAHWDRNNSGAVDDDVDGGQVPVSVSAIYTFVPVEVPLGPKELLVLMALVLAALGAARLRRR